MNDEAVTALSVTHVLEIDQTKRLKNFLIFEQALSVIHGQTNNC